MLVKFLRDWKYAHKGIRVVTYTQGAEVELDDVAGAQALAEKVAEKLVGKPKLTHPAPKEETPPAPKEETPPAPKEETPPAPKEETGESSGNGTEKLAPSSPLGLASGRKTSTTSGKK